MCALSIVDIVRVLTESANAVVIGPILKYNFLKKKALFNCTKKSYS